MTMTMVVVQGVRLVLRIVGVTFLVFHVVSSLWSAFKLEQRQSHHHGNNSPSSSNNRMLQELTDILRFGGEPPPEILPLPHCGGDCDLDHECAIGLICWQREIGEPVPGCYMKDLSASRTDFCVRETDAWAHAAALQEFTPTPTFDPGKVTSTPTLVPSAGETSDSTTNQPTRAPSFVTTTSSPTVATTASSPILATTSSPTQAQSIINLQNAIGFGPFPPSTPPTFEFRGPPSSMAPTTDSWLFLMDHADPVPLIYVGNDGTFNAPYPLGPCQSDCDSDADCFGNLMCYQREGGEKVPGCLGEDKTLSDYCVFPSEFLEQQAESTQPWQNGFMLKLYWEEGYRWQNETIERKWCVTRNYTGSPVTGKCWYGDYSLPCNASETYIDKCSKDDNPDPRQLWDFVPVSADEVLIQAYEEDRCWQRFRRNITLETCNSTNPRQRWWAVRGGFNEQKFELSQKLQPNYCVNQDHHPKPGEVVKMFLCEKVRHPSHETSWWNVYMGNPNR